MKTAAKLLALLLFAVSPAPTFTLALRCVATPRRLRRQHKAAHGFSGYAGAVLYLLHSEARRRLTSFKRTAAMPVLVHSNVKPL